MFNDKIVKRVLAATFIIIIGILIFYGLRPYINYFLGAFILFILFKPSYSYLTKKLNWNKRVTAFFVIFVIVLIVVIPLTIVTALVFNEAKQILLNEDLIENSIDFINEFFPEMNLKEKLVEKFADLSDTMAVLLLDIFKGAGSQIIGLVILFFVLYYLFVTDDKKIKEMLISIFPFSKKNSKRLLEELERITYTTIIATGVIALIQSLFLVVSFLLAGISGAFLWGFVAFVLSFLPVIGPPILWVPAALYMLYQGSYVGAGIILLFGIISMNIDNLLRPIIQEKIGKMHPLVSLLGIFLGINLFGLIGIVIGPLLLSYFILSIKMFKEENYEE